MNFDSVPQSASSPADDQFDLDLPSTPKEEPKTVSEEPTAAVATRTTDHSDQTKMDRVLLVAGPLFLIVSLAVSLIATFNTTKAPETFVGEGEEQWVSGISNDEYLRIAPENPSIVTAYADSQKFEVLNSETAYSYDNPYFEWEPGVVNEQGVNIVGYQVFFGDNYGSGPLENHALYSDENGFVIQGNTFSPSEYGFEMVPGTTYYLMVKTLTDGLVQHGYDRDSGTPAKVLFTYIYQ